MTHPTPRNAPYLFLAAGLAALIAIPSLAQDGDTPPPVKTGIRWIDWAAEQVDFTLREAEPADPATDPSAEAAPAEPATGAPAEPEPEEPATEPLPELSPTHSIETMEMLRLQQEVRLLRELIEEGVVGRVTALEAEVHELKASLKAQRTGGSVVPQPDEPDQARLSLPDAQLEMKKAQARKSEKPAKVQPATPAATEPFAFTVVDEWGRSPEAVAEQGGKASTLIGVAGLVPPGSTRADITALAKELRTKYKGYDNIVIEVFNSETAAKAFADAQTVDGDSRVLSISKSKADGRDLMIYFGGEVPEVLTPGAP